MKEIDSLNGSGIDETIPEGFYNMWHFCLGFLRKNQ
jgi:hypothetical protein